MSRSVRFAPGERVLTQGRPANSLLLVREGSAQVRIDDEDPPLEVGPGELLGELSLLTGDPISARVTAGTGLCAAVWDEKTFHDLFERQVEFRDWVTRRVVERLRSRTRRPRHGDATRAVLVVDRSTAEELAPLLRQVLYYAGRDVAIFLAKKLASLGAWIESTLQVESRVWTPEIARQVADLEGPWLLLTGPTGAVPRGPGLGVRELHVDSSSQPFEGQTRRPVPQRARCVRIQGPDDSRPLQDRWCHRWTPGHLERARDACPGEELRSAEPDIDEVARFLTGREIGVALGAGAARGFAHLGVLEVLERERVPLDYVCGSSMGGIVCLLHARFGRVDWAASTMRELIGSNRKIRDPRLWPRRSLLRGSKIARAARIGVSDLRIEQLARPTAVVAVDLLSGRRVVLDRGPVGQAILATTAIPGVFPPVPIGDYELVDGGIATRIPTDLLAARGCGLRIAVNVVPEPRVQSRAQASAGLGRILGRSLELMSWYQGEGAHQDADLTLEPRGALLGSTDFDRMDDAVAAGRACAEAALPALHRTVGRLLQPSAPALPSSTTCAP